MISNRRSIRSAGALSLLCAVTVACAANEPSPPASAAGPALVGTEWKLVEFRSSDDSIGAIRPGVDEVYTLRLEPGGNAVMTLFCNRGTGQWKSPDPAAKMGSLTIEPGIRTLAACPPSPLERLGDDFAHVRTFVIADGKLHLNLKMSSGDYVWEPAK